jgi:copper(I)-binding protein
LMTFESGTGAMRMRSVHAIEIPPDSAVSLDPRGLHVWLADLKAPLREGQTFALTLRFEKAGDRQVTVKVVPPSAAPPLPPI